MLLVEERFYIEPKACGPNEVRSVSSQTNPGPPADELRKAIEDEHLSEPDRSRYRKPNYRRQVRNEVKMDAENGQRLWITRDQEHRVDGVKCKKLPVSSNYRGGREEREEH